MLMRYYWGLGVGHTYAHEPTTGSVKEALHPPPPSEPEIVIPDCHGDEEDSDSNSSSRSLSPDLDDSDPDDLDIEISAMYNWESQDEEEREYEF